MNTNLFHDSNNTLPILKSISQETGLYLTYLLENKTWNVIQYISGSNQAMHCANKKDLFMSMTCLYGFERKAT